MAATQESIKILAFDTSSYRGSVAIVYGAEIRGEANLYIERDHSGRLLASIDFLMNMLDIRMERIDALAVATGPGSFTGLRIGLATAKSLAATAEKPIVPVTVMEALTYKARFFDGLISPVIDAGRGEVYAGLYQAKGAEITRLEKDRLLLPEEWAKSLPRDRKIGFVGDGAIRYVDLLSRGRRRLLLEIELFLAGAVGQFAARHMERARRAADLTEAYYIRPPDVELARRLAKRA